MAHYKTNSLKVTYREYWNLSRFPRVLLPWLYKLLGIPIQLSSGIPEHIPFKEALVDTASIPETVRSKLAAKSEGLCALGFSKWWYNTSKDSLMKGFGYAATSIHQSGEAIAKIVYAKHGTRENLVIGFVSELEEGRIISTTDNKPRLAHGPEIEVARLVGASPEKIWQRHEQRLTAAKSKRRPITFNGLDDVARFSDALAERTYNFHIGRGVWVPMTPAEVDALRQKRLSQL